MIDLEYEMTFAERIEGPLGPTAGSPARLCWKIAEATLAGPRIAASLAMPGTDWIRVDSNGIRRQDQRTQFLTDDGTLILMRYDAALIRGDEEFARALASGWETTYSAQYMYMTPQFDVSQDTYDWLTQSLFIGRGRLAGPERVEYELYRSANLNVSQLVQHLWRHGLPTDHGPAGGPRSAPARDRRSGSAARKGPLGRSPRRR
jgi:hypothetical protein